MKGTKKLLTFVLALVSIVCACFAFASCSEVEPPETVKKVHTVTLQHESANVVGVLEKELSLGTVQFTASVVCDAGAVATLTYASSDTTVATIDQTGLATLVCAGETVISASAGDKKHEIVLIVTDSSTKEGHTVTVNGGITQTPKANEGEIVYLTPVIPEDKEFNGWTWDDNIIKVTGNSFEMPATDVTISANFVNKLADIKVVEAPDSNKIAKGSPLNIDGLIIMAKSALSGEEWNVTNDCTFSEFDGGESITATYTLGEVTRTAEIEVEEIIGYTVSPSKVQQNAASKSTMNVVPSDVDGELADYKDTGYIAGTQGSTLKFSTQNVTFCVSNLSAMNEFTFYFYSEISANARLTAGVASADYYKSSDATYTGTTPNSVYETYLNDKFEIFANGSEQPSVINPAAKANAYTQTSGSWGVCGHFNDAYLFDMKVVKGWNTVRFYAKANRAPNVSYVKVEFTGKALTEFASDITMGVLEGIVFTTAPVDLDTELADFKGTGALYLYNPRNSDNYEVGKEGSYNAIKGAMKGDKATYYFYAGGTGTVKISIIAASSAYYKTSDATYSGSTPNAVREISFKNHYGIKLNGTAVTALDTAFIPAYQQEAGSWAVCQRFVEVHLLTIDITKGWNAIEFECISTDVANLSTMKIEYQYD